MNNRARIICKRYEIRIRIEWAPPSPRFRSGRAFKRRATAKRAGTETPIHRGYPISELREFIATPSPRACCPGAAAGLGLPVGLNYCRNPPKPFKLLARLRISTSSTLKTRDTAWRRSLPACRITCIFSNAEQFINGVLARRR